MPQVKVNEIDQSVVTRVVSNDYVKILVPVITSFGPSVDLQTESITDCPTFTDYTEFNKLFGDTDPEFNPIPNDYTRIYARELMKKGAAVSVVRLNGSCGSKAGLQISSNPAADRTVTPTFGTTGNEHIGSANMAALATAGYVLDGVDSAEGKYYYETTNVRKVTVDETTTATITTSNSILPGSRWTVFTTNGTTIETGTASSGTAGTTITLTKIASVTDNQDVKVCYQLDTDVELNQYDILRNRLLYMGEKAADYTFAPQISGIKAKYTGSFGNNIAIGISPIVSANVSEKNQYANITVYRVYKNVRYVANKPIVTITRAVPLETKRVSTNPNSIYYFEDVEFEYIEIVPTANARSELSLIWSNIEGNPATETIDDQSVPITVYSGFPEISIRSSAYVWDGTSATPEKRSAQYRADSILTGGKDFAFSNELYAKLERGFKGYIENSSATGAFDIGDVDLYNSEVYGSVEQTVDGKSIETKPGIINEIYAQLANVYKNFDDPYIFDFDFITSSGLVYDEWFTKLENGHLVPVRSTSTGVSEYLEVSSDGTISTYKKVNPIHDEMRSLVETRKDCIALFDVPNTYDRTLIVDYSGMLNTSYGTIHFPWCYVKDPNYTNNQLLVSPSYVFLYTFLSNVINNVEAQKWAPPAGVKRATASVVVKPEFEIGSTLLNAWQNDNIMRVNPIMRLKQYGYVIFGQYTTLQAIDMYTHSALESLNVRLIANVVKKKIFDVCLNLAFEPNTSKLWLKFYAAMDEFLRYMQYNEGLYGYKIVMDESTVTTDDINQLRCPGKVFISPTRTAEFFDIDFIITAAGVTFTGE